MSQKTSSKINAWQGSEFASVTGKLLKCLSVSVSVQSLFYAVYVVCFFDERKCMLKHTCNF